VREKNPGSERGESVSWLVGDFVTTKAPLWETKKRRKHDTADRQQETWKRKKKRNKIEKERKEE
jgi:hypothetical protein